LKDQPPWAGVPVCALADPFRVDRPGLPVWRPWIDFESGNQSQRFFTVAARSQEEFLQPELHPDLWPSRMALWPSLGVGRKEQPPWAEVQASVMANPFRVDRPGLPVWRPWVHFESGNQSHRFFQFAAGSKEEFLQPEHHPDLWFSRMAPGPSLGVGRKEQSPWADSPASVMANPFRLDRLGLPVWWPALRPVAGFGLEAEQNSGIQSGLDSNRPGQPV
jgi:hypothetical protein